jgi:hypothetical protein
VPPAHLDSTFPPSPYRHARTDAAHSVRLFPIVEKIEAPPPPQGLGGGSKHRDWQILRLAKLFTLFLDIRE